MRLPPASRIALAPILALLLPSCAVRRTIATPPLNGNGIYAGEPKVYDDASLEAMLRAAQSRVGQLSAFDQTSILKNLGTVQGGSATQTQAAGQVSGLPKPGATATAVTPNNPALPNPPAFTLPSSYTPAAADIFNEQVQLNYQMTNLQLLLEGALSDEFVVATMAKRRETFGLPIAIQTPPGSLYRHAAAEVEVSVCSPPQSLEGDPSLVNLLPREKTYNVANIVSKSASASGGAIVGIVNFGGSFLRARQTFYLVQDQDTIAVPLPPEKDACVADRVDTANRPVTAVKSSSVRFAWQFRPVLGQTVVRDGTRQTFAQVALPPELGSVGCSARVTIRSRWREYDAKTGRIGKVLADTESSPQVFEMGNFDVPPTPRTVQSEDNGDGTVTVRAMGGFKAGTRVRIGSQILDATSPLFEQSATEIRFTAPAAQIAAVGASLLNRDGTEAPVVTGGTSESLGSCAAPKVPQPAKPAEGEGAAHVPLPGAPPAAAPAPAAADLVLTPLTDSTSILTLKLDSSDAPETGEIGVVLIGGQVFGLRNAPFLERDATHVKLVAGNDLLRTNKVVKWVRLFSSKPPRLYTAGPVVYAVSGLTLLASGATGPAPAGKTGNYYAVTGSSLDGLTILDPPNTAWLASANTAALKEFFLPDEVAKLYKSIVVQHGSDAPAILSLPAAPAAQAAAPAAPAKPAIDPQPAAGIAATSKSLTVTGSGMTQVAAVFYNLTPLPFTAANDKSLTVSQLPALGSPGITLVFVYADKSLQPYFVPVAVH
jgi:hypothetical protein